MADVSTPEIAEVFAVNALAPFVLNARLQPLLAATAKLPLPHQPSESRGARSGEAAGDAAGTTDGSRDERSTTGGAARVAADAPGDGGGAAGAAAAGGATSTSTGATYIVNVSAMEGKFYRHKMPTHPHTNMAKAALNMLTRTSAADLATHHRIFMTAVDTGWINDENPRGRAARTAETHHFQTPIDEVDAAARVLHPVFEGVATGSPRYGVFLKDFAETEW